MQLLYYLQYDQKIKTLSERFRGTQILNLEIFQYTPIKLYQQMNSYEKYLHIKYAHTKVTTIIIYVNI